ncbi:hypothetical protein ACFSZS_18895 [Seohaeicola zhoushanensis]
MSAESQVQNILALRAADVRVSDGVNLGDALSILDEIEPDDTYQLTEGAEPCRLALDIAAEGGIRIAEGTGAGQPGAALHLDGALVLMAPDGQTMDAIVLVEVDGNTEIAAIYLLPLARLAPRGLSRGLEGQRSRPPPLCPGGLRLVHPRHPHHHGLGRAGADRGPAHR